MIFEFKHYYTEHYVQRFIRANQERFGLSNLQYLMHKGGGGDFGGFYNGEYIKIEVEWLYNDYEGSVTPIRS
jgi:hypothetical protein